MKFCLFFDSTDSCPTAIALLYQNCYLLLLQKPLLYRPRLGNLLERRKPPQRHSVFGNCWKRSALQTFSYLEEELMCHRSSTDSLMKTMALNGQTQTLC